MVLIWIFVLSALPNARSAGSIFCPDPEDQNADHMTDCLGLRFTWLHSLLDNFPSLVSFALKLRCATGLCPRDLEDYGCSCRYVAVGDPVDPLDLCCEAHRWCYLSAAPCRPELPPLPDNFTCSHANSSCDGSDWCQQRFCECDRAAIDCMTQSSYNSSLRGLAASMCSATNHTDVLSGTERTGEAFRAADLLSGGNDSVSFLLSNSSLLSAELDLLMTGGVDNRSDTAGMDADLITPPPPAPPLLLMPAEEFEEGEGDAEEEATHASFLSEDLNEAATEEALGLDEMNGNQTTHNPSAVGHDSVSFARDRETLSEAESEPIDSSLSFGDRNMETSSAAARHADVTPQSRTTTSLRTTTPTEPTPPGLRESSEEGERL
uniref:Phospholipase A2 n=1 Tax=Sparus aurata TaxID=8175 RepID=A0A671WY85_SPAAU